MDKLALRPIDMAEKVIDQGDEVFVAQADRLVKKLQQVLSRYPLQRPALQD